METNFDRVYVAYIYLANNECGNEKMEEVARKFFEDYRGPEPLIVMVHEHAGWYLGYIRIGSTLRVAYSANDMAIFPEDIEEFRGKASSAEWKMIEEIRR